MHDLLFEKMITIQYFIRYIFYFGNYYMRTFCDRYSLFFKSLIHPYTYYNAASLIDLTIFLPFHGPDVSFISSVNFPLFQRESIQGTSHALFYYKKHPSLFLADGIHSRSDIRPPPRDSFEPIQASKVSRFPHDIFPS